MAKQFTLGKNERLKGRKPIEKLFNEGKSFAVFPFRVYFVASRQSPVSSRQSATHSHQDGNQKSTIITRLSESGKPQTSNLKPQTSNLLFGVGVSGKHFKKAVDRNRIKRLTREAYRLEKIPLQEKLKEKSFRLHVFFIYTGKELTDFNTIREKTGVILKKLWKLADENNLADT